MLKYKDPKQHTAIYLVIGTDDFLLNEAVHYIKQSWRQKKTLDASRFEVLRMYLETPNHWEELIQTANSYALFYDQRMIDAIFYKNTFDVKTKALLNQYATSPNLDCLLIIRAPSITEKQCADFKKQPSITCVCIQSLNNSAQIQWVKQALKNQKLNYTDEIPQYIQTYTQGNLHAANQTIERLALIHEPNDIVTLDTVKAQCLDERQFKNYEISSACLDGHPQKAIAFTRRARLDQVEPVLILWMITQELRLLEQMKAGASPQALNIYSFRIQQYQRASQRLSIGTLYDLIQQSQTLDEHIKSGSPQQTWIMLEQLILNFAH